MKLIIQIPCYNEAETLPVTVRDLPRTVPGVDQVELLVIDDGSQDGTYQVARDLRVHHIYRFPRRVGLARVFMAGLDQALRAGADIIVNTDADNQYDACDLPALIAPILSRRADIVVGDRGVATLEHFSPSKRLLQRVGSWVVQLASGLKVPDATSGFRAFSRDAALQLRVVGGFTYTLETLIQAGACNLSIAYVPVRTRPQIRESRLIRSIPRYLLQSAITILRSYMMYKPMTVFAMIGGLMFLLGLIPSLRFLYYYFAGDGAGHIQSLIFAAVLLILGFQIMLIGLIADLVGFNRKILEQTLYRLRKLELSERHSAPMDDLPYKPGYKE